MVIFAWIILGLIAIKATVKGAMLLGAIMAANSDPTKKVNFNFSWISFIVIFSTMVFLILYLVL